jgi:hypothetical protein
MSIRSAANSDLTLRNLTITGTLTIQDASENDVYENLDITDTLTTTNLVVSENTSLNNTTTNNMTVLELMNCQNGLNVVAGTSLFNEDVQCQSGLTCMDFSVNNRATILDLDVNGTSNLIDVSMNNLFSGGTVNCQGPLTVEYDVQCQTGLTCTDFSVNDQATILNLNVNGSTNMIDVSMNNLYVGNSSTVNELTVITNTQINGNLNVSGVISSSNDVNETQMEVLTYQLTGNANTVYSTMALTNNGTETTNYVVLPSIYYGYTGSSGTYNAQDSSGALGQIIISNITESSFDWYVSKSTGNNVNVLLLFLVIYNVDGSTYPKIYS